MSAPCVCPLAGYCERHEVRKGEAWHRLCQTRDRYREMWDDGRGPGQKPKPLTEKQLALKAKVDAARDRERRLIDWIRLFRLPDEKGIGDTAYRLYMRSSKSPDASAILNRLLSQCSCSRTDAADRLNARHPY